MAMASFRGECPDLAPPPCGTVVRYTVDPDAFQEMDNRHATTRKKMCGYVGHNLVPAVN